MLRAKPWRWVAVCFPAFSCILILGRETVELHGICMDVLQDAMKQLKLHIWRAWRMWWRGLSLHWEALAADMTVTVQDWPGHSSRNACTGLAASPSIVT